MGLVLSVHRARRLLTLHRGLEALSLHVRLRCDRNARPSVASGLGRATVMHRPSLLSDNGASYVAGDLAKWLENKGMLHVRAAPYHPQTQGKTERWPQTLKSHILLDNYYLPGDLERQIDTFVAGP